MSKAVTLIVAAILIGAFDQSSAKTWGETRAWNFNVYLDEDPVGYHRFSLNDNDAIRQLHSEARFTVKLLMIKAYAYQHEALETWQGNCLIELNTNTDDNGEKIAVLGSERNGGFEVKKGSQTEKLPACIMTFAYWNPLMLKQNRLLNPQNGEYTNVRIQSLGREGITVRSETVAAEKYHLDAGKFQIDLWYADGGRWVGLDSLLENGRKLRYRIE